MVLKYYLFIPHLHLDWAKDARVTERSHFSHSPRLHWGCLSSIRSVHSVTDDCDHSVLSSGLQLHDALFSMTDWPTREPPGAAPPRDLCPWNICTAPHQTDVPNSLLSLSCSQNRQKSHSTDPSETMTGRFVLGCVLAGDKYTLDGHMMAHWSFRCHASEVKWSLSFWTLLN